MQTRPGWRTLIFCIALATLPRASEASKAYTLLQSLAREMTFRTAAAHPLQATTLGLTQYDGDVDQVTAAQRRAEIARIRGWKRRLTAVPLSHATLAERNDARLLSAQLTAMERQFTVYRTDEKDYTASANAIVNALFTQFQFLPDPARTNASEVALAWDHIVMRMEKAPAYIRDGQKRVTQPGHLFGIAGAQQLDGAPSFLAGALTEAAKAQLSAEKFKRFTLARDALLKSIASTVRYVRAHVAQWPENYAIGRAAYDRALRDEALLPFTSADIERMGADELAHGWAVQIWLEDQARRRGTPIGPETGGGLAPDGTALVGYYRERIAELHRWMAENQVITIPQWLGEVKVVETPKFMQPISPGAFMQSPRLFAKESTGFYFITPSNSLADSARRLDVNEDFDRDRIWSTSAHEAMPGHFLQLSIARRHPDFVRKIVSSGVFAEGWAFYGEEMLVQLGMYGDNLDGRYYTAQWERVRGARAIVDPKLASGEWSYQQAVAFFARESGFTRKASEAAVAGIALGPLYVINYTVGRYQLQDLLAEYWRRMGKRGSLHDFHDRLLSYGGVPFSVVAPELLADLNKGADQVRAAANY